MSTSVCLGKVWRAVALGAGLLWITSIGAFAAGPADASGRNFDARDAEKAVVAAVPEVGQLKGVERLRFQVPELSVRFDERLGVTRTLSNPVGFLTVASGKQPMEAALDFVATNLDALGLTADDVAEFEVTDQVTSEVTGVTHIYLRQMRDGIPSYNSQLHVNVTADGRILSVNNAFQTGMGQVRHIPVPTLSAADAVAVAAAELGLVVARPAILSTEDGPRQQTRLDPAGISLEPIEASLMWLPIQRGQSRLVWNFQIQTLDQQHWFDINVDARSGKLWTRFDWTSDAQYRVYAQPVESPQHTTPLPPSDARSLVVNPQSNATNASPNGWHSTGTTNYTITRGNNAHAYEDRDANNNPPTTDVNCGSSLNCDFTINLSTTPNNWIPASVTNVFYWTNIIHDVQYQYGFTEAAGNFQVNNFGKGGSGNDDVRAEAQDGGGNCNANFATPVDGGRPRMQMYTCTNATPARDGDLDAGVIVHEYGHGISTRQVGGPGNSSCLNNNQQPGEGWSDWFGLVYTAEVGDAGTDQRGIGSYLFALAPDGTIRPQPYSTNPAINDYTYASIAGKTIPHGVGSVWAQAIWEVYWALVGQYGFSSNLYNATGGAGNQRALLYVNEGLKNTACSPTFLDTRDGIIAAATSLNGGQDVCLIWQAFAAYGLGTNASTPGPSSTTATNGFNVPTSCGCTSFPAAPTGLTATPNGNNRIDLAWNSVSGATSYKVFRSTTSGGPYTEIATVTTNSYSNTGIAPGTYFYVVQAVNSSGCASGNSNQASATATGPACTTTTLYSNTFETGSGLSNWSKGIFGGSSSADWRGIQTCTAQGGTKIFRFGGTSCTANYASNRFTFAQPNGTGGVSVPAGSTTTRLTFGHRYRFENGFDGGTLTLSLNGTNYFLVPSSAIISGQNYNGTVSATCPPAGAAGASIFTGIQTSFVNTTVDLDAACDAVTGGSGGCAGQALRIGFTGITDCSVTDDGWFLDNVTVTACTP